ncbi:MAG: hypothetical protein AVDCRST_MAG95-2347 [uncultured Adhaeribacter sp.]|uniref:Uncharacterized protein n=1 Tax=uncultured Adhaeribacter sp. TaxID=448109 RepID=A0A6J4IY96_9BACT|nr:MAG: hypothetical protein AVDCRST_MAG95-2347 [uncultured Adhaeribacter sp.]
MDITKEEFDEKFRETLDDLLLTMAEHPEVEPSKFFGMACVLENLSFFGPVLYDALQNSKKI